MQNTFNQVEADAWQGLCLSVNQCISEVKRRTTDELLFIGCLIFGGQLVEFFFEAFGKIG